MSKTLLLLRHAKSSWKVPSFADHDRPLSKRGANAAPEVGRFLVKQGVLPELILSSTATRARATAELVAEECAFRGPLVTNERLYLATPDLLLEEIGALDDALTVVMLVGHNPGLEELLEILGGSAERMPTATLAVCELAVDHWREVRRKTQGSLLHVFRPRENLD